MIKVSVIVPVYNVENYLQECLNSILCQTLREIEIICVNDGSTDESGEILRQAAARDDRIRIIEQPNGGYGKAMNTGLDAAVGEYVGIVEPDDYVAVETFEQLYEIAKQQDLDMVRADFYRFTEESETGDLHFVRVHLYPQSEDYHVVFDASETAHLPNYLVNTWNGIYRREFLEKHQIRHNETPGASFQDNGFFFQCYTHAKRAMAVDQAYYRNRRDNPNSSVHDKEKVYAIHQEYDWIRDRLMEEPEVWNRFKYLYWNLRIANYIGTIDRIGDGYKREYIRFLSREMQAVEPSGLLKREYYSDSLWSKVQLILHDPDSYADQKLHIHKEGASVEAIKKSASYRAGYVLTILPRLLKKAIRRMKS